MNLPDYSKAEAAAMLRVSIRTLRRWMAAGEISYYRAGIRPRFGEHHIQEFLQKCQQKANR